MARKKMITTINITDIEFPNKGIGNFEGKKIVIKNTLPGQIINAELSKKKDSYQGKILEVLEKSPSEIKPSCEDFSICGGCTYQNISYEDELKIKEKMVKDLFESKNIDFSKYLGISKAVSISGYRNKMEFSFGDEEKGGKLALGMRKRHSYYEVVTSKHCSIVDEDYRKIVSCCLEFFQNSEDTFYHKATHEGSLRHLVVRKGYFTKELLINIVTTSNLKSNLLELKDKLLSLELESEIKGILQTINNSVADVVICDKLNVLYGNDFFNEKLFNLNFKISAFSFFQTNSRGAEKLYEIVKDFIADSKDKIIFDLYCGTGTIAQIVSEKAKEVIGIEIVEEAVKVAKENALQNNIFNCSFISGDILKVIDNLKVKPDILILDPPREGINPKALEKLVKFAAESIIYISCKPSSLVNDLKYFLDNGYTISKIRLCDMFPRTYHVETVVLLQRN